MNFGSDRFVLIASHICDSGSNIASPYHLCQKTPANQEEEEHEDVVAEDENSQFVRFMKTAVQKNKKFKGKSFAVMILVFDLKETIYFILEVFQ